MRFFGKQIALLGLIRRHDFHFRLPVLLLNSAPFIILAIILLILNAFVEPHPVDDISYIASSSKMSLLPFLSSRFVNWSARLTTDSMIFFIFGLPLWCFRMVNTIVGVIFPISLAVHLFGRKFLNRDDSNMRWILWFYSFSFGFLSFHVISQSMFWMSGAVGYLWTVTMGSIALIPISDVMWHKTSGFPGGSLWLQPIYWFGAIYSCLGSEQVCIIVGMITFVSLISMVSRGHKIHFSLVVLFVLITLCVFALVFAPAQYNRFIAEIENWFPDFLNLSIEKHISLGFYWLQYHLIITNRIILILYYLFFLLEYPARGQRRYQLRSDYLRIGVWAIFILLLITTLDATYIIPNITNPLNGLLTQSIVANYSIEAPPMKSIQFINIFFTYILWAGVLLFVPIRLGHALKHLSIHRGSVFFLLFASFCSACLLIFSPTIFASGTRSWYPFGILSVFILGVLFYSVSNRISRFIRWIIIAFPIFQIACFIMSWRHYGFVVFF